MSSDAAELTRISVNPCDLFSETTPSRLGWLSDQVELSVDSEEVLRWLGTYPTLGILSSHPSRNAFRTPAWQQALDSILEQARRNSSVVLFSQSAPYAQSIAFACSRLEIPWASATTRAENSPTKSHQSFGSSRQIVLNCKGQIASEKLPLDDLAVAVLAQRVVGLHVTPGGKTAAILNRLLNCSQHVPGQVWISAQSKPSRGLDEAQKRWSDAGAVLWFPKPIETLTMSPWSCQHRVVPASLQIHAGISTSLARSDLYLIHTTRARQSLWPDQSNLDLLDEAFRLAWNPNPTPVETLLKIISEQRLLATTARKRTDLRTISFTENPIALLLQMRAFQSHLARWDWEPYGLAIKKTTLERLGAKPVRYLAKKQIDSLDSDQQAYCQPLAEKQGDRDWTIEREWRLAHDLRLAHLPSDEAFVFVACDCEARAMSHHSRWPVYSVEKLSFLSGQLSDHLLG
jgi:hypothetical protein